MNVHAYSPSREVELTSENPIYRISLSGDSRGLIPTRCDVTGVHLMFPDNLKEVRVRIGANVVAVFDREVISEELRTFPIYASLCRYMCISMELVYCANWLAENEEYVYEDEYAVVKEYGESAEIFDGYSCYRGQLVTRRRVPTGDKFRRIVKGVAVNTPPITFDIAERTGMVYHAEVPVLEKIKLSELDGEYRDRLVSEFDMKPHHVYPEYGIVTNKLRYVGNMAGLQYMFR